MSELILEKPKCPVCGMDVKILHNPETFHCGATRLLLKEEEHYLSFRKEPVEWPKKGCPVCGRPMQDQCRIHWISLQLLIEEKSKGEGFERMHCDQLDHFCYVTKAWYDKHRR